MKLSKLRVDTQAQVSGVWLPFGEADGALFECKVARVGTKEYQKLLTQKREDAGFEDASKIPKEVNERLVNEAIAEGLLLDWRGLEDDDGKAIKYTPKRAAELLGDPELEELREWVVIQAANRDNFRKDKLDKAAKN